MTVSRYATQAGKRYQNDLMKYLRDDRGLDAERLVLTGAEDEGDVLLRLPNKVNKFAYEHADERFVIEAKREKGFSLADWIKQAQIEANNYGLHRGLNFDPHFVVVHHARGKGIGQSYVTTTLDEWLRQIR